MESLAHDWQSKIKLNNFYEQVDLKQGDPDKGYDAYFHINYYFAKPVAGKINYVYITHIDSLLKLLKVIKLAWLGVNFICMSNHTKDLLYKICYKSKIQVVVPRSLHFESSAPLTITAGIFFRLYRDNRKSNKEIYRLIDLTKKYKNFKLIIYGNGFEELFSLNNLENVNYINKNFDSIEYQNNLQRCNYVLYFGKDEGAISILDATILGIPIRATNQGYHRDINLPPYSKLYDNPDDILTDIEVEIKNLNKYDSNTGINYLSQEIFYDHKYSIFQKIQTFLRLSFVHNHFIYHNNFIKEIFNVVIYLRNR